MYAATRGPNVKWGAQISNGGAGHHWPPAGDGPGYDFLLVHHAYCTLHKCHENVAICVLKLSGGSW